MLQFCTNGLRFRLQVLQPPLCGEYAPWARSVLLSLLTALVYALTPTTQRYIAVLCFFLSSFFCATLQQNRFPAANEVKA